MAVNDVTGDNLISRTLTKVGEKNYDEIFGQKKKTNGGWTPPSKIQLCNICGKDFNQVKECAWTSCPSNWDESRIDIIGSNGNIGYEIKD